MCSLMYNTPKRNMPASGQRTGIANPLVNYGKTPRWLFARMRLLALEIVIITLSELIYDVPVSLRDPANYSFTHGGKDGYLYPVDRKTYNSSIQFLAQALDKAKIGDKEKLNAFKRLRA